MRQLLLSVLMFGFSGSAVAETGSGESCNFTTATAQVDALETLMDGCVAHLHVFRELGQDCFKWSEYNPDPLAECATDAVGKFRAADQTQMTPEARGAEGWILLWKRYQASVDTLNATYETLDIQSGD